MFESSSLQHIATCASQVLLFQRGLKFLEAEEVEQRVELCGDRVGQGAQFLGAKGLQLRVEDLDNVLEQLGWGLG